MTETEEIKELANFIKEASKSERRCRDCGDGYHVGLEYYDHLPTSEEVAEKLYDIGYRKANEFREPIIEKKAEFYIFDFYKEAQYSIKATCPICNGLLAGVSFPDTSQEKRDYKTKCILNEIPNYCPNCGARLKEVE